MKRSKIIRTVYSIMYFFTAFVNLYLGITQPEVLRGLADSAFIPFIGTILTSAPVILLRLSLIGFMAYQLTLCALLLSRGEWMRVGLAGSVIFHLGILPFGIFNLPNVLIALPPALLLRRELKAANGNNSIKG